MAQVIQTGKTSPVGGALCPSEADLMAFSEGAPSEPASESIFQHVTSCVNCEAALARLAQQSSMNGRYQPTGPADAVVQEPECQRMQQVIREIPQRAGDQEQAGWNNDASQDSTDGTRFSTDDMPVNIASRDANTTEDRATPRAIGRYQVRSILGEGGSGRVYLCHDPQLDRQVALKVAKFGPSMSRLLTDAFLREAKVAARLNHPGIVTVYDADVDEDVGCYIVMECVEGKSLKQVMAEGKVSHEKAADYIAQAADALAYAHERDLVHRDIKPANLLVDRKGKIKVADFGLAVLEEEQRKRAGEFAGTPAYCSPEQVRGEVHHLDGRSDIWSLGVVLYELLTGRRPFGGAHVTDEILHRPPKPPTQIDDSVPAHLEQACLKCLSKDTAGRFANAKDLVRALEGKKKPPRILAALAACRTGAGRDRRRGLHPAA